MATKKNKTLLYVGLAALAGAGYWYYTKQKAAAAAAATASPTTSTPALLPGSSTNLALPDQVVSPGATTRPAAPTVLVQSTPLVTAPLSMPGTATGWPGDPNNGITDAQKTEAIANVKANASAGNWMQFQRVMGLFTPSEWWGIYDLYGRIPPQNGFSNMTPARVQFWHDWRVKYHFMDGTYA